MQVGAMVAYKGRLLASSGPVLRLYEMGKKRLLRKCEYKRCVNWLVEIFSAGMC